MDFTHAVLNSQLNLGPSVVQQATLQRAPLNFLAAATNTGVSTGIVGVPTPGATGITNGVRAARLDPLYPSAPASSIPLPLLLAGGAAALAVVGLVAYKLKKKKGRK